MGDSATPDSVEPHVQESFARELSLFAGQLRDLRLDRGNPSLRDIARRAEQVQVPRPLPHGTLSDVFNGKRLPRLELLLTLVRTLLAFDEDGRPCQALSPRSAELEVWRNRWRTLEALRTAARVASPTPDPPAPDPSSADATPHVPDTDAGPTDPTASDAQDAASLLHAARTEAAGIREVAGARADQLIAEAQAERDQAATELARLRGRVAEELATAREEARGERERAAADAARIRAQARARAAAPGSGPDDQAGAEDFEATPGPRDRTGEDVVIPLEIALEEAAFGVTKDVEMDTAVTCDRCGGKVPSARKCDACRGRGEVPGITRSLLGKVTESRTCAKCRGLGTVLPDPCPQCGGEGRRLSRRTRTVRVPAGIDSGTLIKLVGESAVGPGGGPPGNVYLEIRVRPHEIFERRGDDLHCTVTIPMTAAALGTRIPLETLDGVEEVDIRPGTQYGRTLPFPGRGVPRHNGGGRGDLVVHVEVTVASGLDSVQEDLLRRLARARGEEHPPGEFTPGAQGFFSRLRDAFNGHQPM